MFDQSIYISMDELLDTRFAVLSMIYPEVIDLIKKDHNLYWNRESDNFESIFKGNVKNDVYQKFYNERSKGVDSNSVITSILEDLVRMIHSLIINKNIKREVKEIKLVINTYPYGTYTSAEQKTLKEILLLHIGYDILIDIVNFKPTLLHIDNNYDAVYMYNFVDFIAENINDFVNIKEKKSLDQRTTYKAPALFRNDAIITESKLKEFKLDKFSMLYGLGPYFYDFAIVEQLDIEFFSCLRPSIS